MQSLTISSRGKGIEGETVVIHFISSLWRKGEEERAVEGLRWGSAPYEPMQREWHSCASGVNCDSSSVAMQSERQKLNRWKSPAGSSLLLSTASSGSRAVLKEMGSESAWKEEERGGEHFTFTQRKQMVRTRNQGQLNHSTSIFCFYTVYYTFHPLQICERSRITLYHFLSSLCLCLFRPLPVKDEKRNFITRIYLWMICW